MFGVVTRNESEVDWPEFDRACYEMKDVTGRAAEPVAGAVNMISAFGDTAAVEADSNLAAVDVDGTPATRDQPYFDWSYVCPTHAAYREGILEMVEDAAAEREDVRLDDVGFPRQGYCRCERCRSSFEESDHTGWGAYRAAVIEEFVAAARERVPGRLLLTLYPDPYPGHLFERAGLDVDALEPHVDEFVVPLYDTTYGTTYWIESIASAFADRLAQSLVVELYAVEVDVENLVHAAEVADAYATDVLFGYDASTARAAIRRLRANGRDGVTHGPE